MSFLKKAQEAAAQAAETARQRAQEAATAAGGGGAAGPGQGMVDAAGDGPSGIGPGPAPTTTDVLARSARDAMGMARRGVTTVIEKIDPGTLAELIVRATALQELTNKSLRAKGSPYRIAEISISASIPPAVSFSISRLDDEPETIGPAVVASSELVDRSIESGELVLALDGTTVDGAVGAEPSMEAGPGAMPPSSISPG